ncbi:MAG TPA: alpha/beta hydrolase [Candidatus Ligilactobacillus excrementigallinarum]|uniref:Alpha/beta hydrolase n=1 Tax=Candidatus Ligilactobacillus excrementigallinarum TaxID=2838641 RepID=A0A9D1UXX8_9LACO|nr:alpha/beta hydrolase [Candidatus Ligilactobacillus excrementigallinarum]
MLLAVLIITMLTLYCFDTAFYANPKRKDDLHDVPNTPQYQPYHAEMIKLIDELDNTKYEAVQTQSFDGLTLRGRLYLYDEHAPIEIAFNGYRTTGVHDAGGVYQIARRRGHNILIVDQRATGISDGKVISFGINERYDVLSWIKYINSRFNSQMKIILVGGSLGGATVLMASDLQLPENVVGIVADSAYSSPKAIIKKVIRGMHLPADFMYVFVKFAAKLLGHFDLEATSAKKALKNCKLPVLIIHGEADRYVPCRMADENFQACNSPIKQLLKIPNGPHDISLLVDWDTYQNTVNDFFDKIDV